MAIPTTKSPDHVRCVVQQHGGQCGWFDCSEVFGYLPTAEAALRRWREDHPDERFRLASLEWGDDS